MLFALYVCRYTDVNIKFIYKSFWNNHTYMDKMYLNLDSFGCINNLWDITMSWDIIESSPRCFVCGHSFNYWVTKEMDNSINTLWLAQTWVIAAGLYYHWLFDLLQRMHSTTVGLRHLQIGSVCSIWSRVSLSILDFSCKNTQSSDYWQAVGRGGKAHLPLLTTLNDIWMTPIRNPN